MSAQVKNPTEVMGHFDYIDAERAYGWAFEPGDTKKRLTIEIICEDNVVGRGVANIWHKDLAETGIGDGRYHFCLPLSYEICDEALHTLTARDATTGLELEGGPHIFKGHAKPQLADVMSREEGLLLLRNLLQQPKFAEHLPRKKNYFNAFVFASLLQETYQLEQARAAYVAIAQAMGHNALLLCKIAETWLLQNQPESALEAYKKAITEDFKLPHAHAGMAAALAKKGHAKEAGDSSRIASSLKSSFLKSLKNAPQQTATAFSHIKKENNTITALPMTEDRLAQSPRKPPPSTPTTAYDALKTYRACVDPHANRASYIALSLHSEKLDQLAAELNRAENILLEQKHPSKTVWTQISDI